MRRGGNGVRDAPTDLLVCFPSRAHLSLIPKPICSPSRPTTHHHHQRRRHPTTNRGQASPLFRTPTKPNNHQIVSDPMIGSEPTSPKVTCSGQIKVRPNTRSKSGPDPKTWLDSICLKKDIMHFLAAFRFDMRCFGSTDSTSDQDDDEDHEEEEEDEERELGARNIFSKWFTVLEEKESDDAFKNEPEEGDDGGSGIGSDSSVPPPSIALLLMRCRSAPSKGGGVEVVREEREKEEGLLLMSNAPDFFKVSTEIAKETWVVGSVDPLPRSRSWKR